MPAGRTPEWGCCRCKASACLGRSWCVEVVDLIVVPCVSSVYIGRLRRWSSFRRPVAGIATYFSAQCKDNPRCTHHNAAGGTLRTGDRSLCYGTLDVETSPT